MFCALHVRQCANDWTDLVPGRYFKVLIQEMNLKVDQGFLSAILELFAANEPLPREQEVSHTWVAPCWPGRACLSKYEVNAAVCKWPLTWTLTCPLHQPSHQLTDRQTATTVVYVRVWWITETRKDPACTLADMRINVLLHSKWK